MGEGLPGAKQYLAARDAEQAGRYADALAGYRQCIQAGGDLAGYACVRAAVSRARGGDSAGGAQQLKTLADQDGPWALMARAELALLDQRIGKPGEAAVLLEPLVTRPITPKWLEPYRRAYGDSLIASSADRDRAEGYALFSAMLAEARTRTQRLEASKRLMTSPDIAQRMDAATAFVHAGEWADAAATLGAAAASRVERGRFAAQEAYLRARIQLGTHRDKEAARAALLDVAKKYPDTEWGRLATAHAARSYFTAGEEPKTKPKKEAAGEAARRQKYREAADRLFKLLAEQSPDTKETGDALWWLASQHAERSDEPGGKHRALAAYLHLARACPSHERTPDALFRAAALYGELDDPTNRLKVLETIVNKYPRADTAPAAAFACGRALTADGDLNGAAQMFELAVQNGGVGNFYSHRACQKLAERGDDRHGAPEAIAIVGAGGYLRPLALTCSIPGAPKEAWIERVRFFADNGLEEAEWEALYHAAQLTDPATAAVYLSAIADAGLAATARYVIEKSDWAMIDDRPAPQFLPALYPRAYWETVRKTAGEIGADPMMLLAIARQESVFQARIASQAGATGIMQLMPSTAAWLVKARPEVGAHHAELLEKPASSFRLGGYYYRYILDRQDSNPVFAIASYNAGPGNVSKWRSRIATADLDDFIESIPFDETRDFVKKVLGNYAAYHSIYPDYRKMAAVESESGAE